MSYTFIKILSTDSIGDSLSAVNSNYLNLDEYVTNTIQFSANNLWLPLKDYYKTMSGQFSTIVNQASSNKGKWDSCVSLVSQNSAKWIEPLVVFYANPVASIQNPADITNWLNTNFPPNENLYVENQKAYVNVIIQDTTVNSMPPILFANSTTCVTSDLNIAFNCSTSFTGTAACSNGNKACGGSSPCTENVAEPCYYAQTGGHYYSPSIEATLYTSYTDISEDTNIHCLLYNMEGCVWNYVKQI